MMTVLFLGTLLVLVVFLSRKRSPYLEPVSEPSSDLYARSLVLTMREHRAFIESRKPMIYRLMTTRYEHYDWHQEGF